MRFTSTGQGNYKKHKGKGCGSYLPVDQLWRRF